PLKSSDLRRTTRGQRNLRPFRFRWLASLVVSPLLGVFGCSGGMQQIDAETQRLLKESAREVNGLAPQREWRSPRIDKDQVTRTDLETANPPAGSLQFTSRPPAADDPAREAADVAARLE